MVICEFTRANNLKNNDLLSIYSLLKKKKLFMALNKQKPIQTRGYMGFLGN
jgi:hypothetical protein